MLADVLMVRTFAEEVYTQYALYRTAAGPTITAIPLLLTVSALLLALNMWFGHHGGRSPWSFGGPVRVLKLGTWRVPVAAVCGVVVVGLLGAPAYCLAERIGDWHAFTVAAAGLRPELAFSAVAAACGASVIVAFSVGVAWAMARVRLLRWVLTAALALTLATPAPVNGVTLAQTLNRPGWLGDIHASPAVVVLGYVVRFWPVGVLLLLSGTKRVPEDTERSARVDGCNWIRLQRHVYWPELRADMLVAWLIVAILCFGEVACTVILAPPGWNPASVRALTLIHFGVYRDLAVLTVLSVACIAVPWFALLIALRARIGHSERLPRQDSPSMESTHPQDASS